MPFTLIVEDGTGLSTANALASNASVTALLLGHPFGTAWATCTTQNECIAEASAWLSRLRWIGLPLTTTQALAFPRLYLTLPDRDASETTSQGNFGNYIYFPSNAVPPFAARAVARLALYLAQQTESPFVPTGLTDNSAFRVGPIQLTPVVSGKIPLDVMQEIRAMLRPMGATVTRA